MFKHLLTIFSVICGVRQAFGFCRDITLESCTRDYPFDIFILPTEELCQQLCREDYADKCIFFLYGREHENCELFDFSEQEFADSCQKFGGTPEPSLLECQQSNDPCLLFTEGNCAYDGDLLYGLLDIDSRSDCQYQCLGFDGCEYFIHDSFKKSCEFRSSTSRTCEVVRGPPNPAIGECSVNPTPTTTEATNSNCKDITLDVCGNADQTTPFETVKLLEGQEEKVCQEICRDIYPVDRCIFFIYDREDRLCQLFDFDEQIYVDSCKKIAATPKPDLAECKESNDPCTEFIEGYCIYGGDLLENAVDISSPSACQILCQINSLCNYFVYNADERNCQLLSSSSRTCDLIRGPPNPAIEECSDNPIQRCPDGWIDSEEGCFYFANEEEGMTWYEAIDYCKGLDAYLAEVLNAETQSLLVAQAELLSQTQRHWWLGASDEENEGSWKWVRTGEPLDFNSWAPGEPNNSGNCLDFRAITNFQWDDVGCYATMYPVCQRK